MRVMATMISKSFNGYIVNMDFNWPLKNNVLD